MEAKEKQYYIYNYASPEAGETGTRHDCMEWYLRYDGGDYRIMDDGDDWACQVKGYSADSFHTVCYVDGADEDEAEAEFLAHLWKHGLSDAFGIVEITPDITEKLQKLGFSTVGDAWSAGYLLDDEDEVN